MHRRVHPQLLHALELGRVDLVDVRQRPAQVLDRMFLVHRLDLIQERVDRAAQLRMHVQRQPGLGDRHRHLSPLLELLGLRIRLQREHRVMQRRVYAFPEEHIVDVTVALEQLHPGDLLDGPVHRLGSSRRRAADAKHPHIETPLGLPFFENREHIRIAARHAERRQPRAIHIANQSLSACLELLRRDPGELARHRARRRNVAPDHARGLSGSVPQNRPFDEPRRIRRVRLDLQNLQSLAVQEDLIVGFLQRDGIIRRDLIQLLARERPRDRP